MEFIWGVFRKFKYQLLLIYIYMLLTEGLLLLQPYILGKTIDGLIHDSYIWLGALVFIYAGSNLFLYKRMVYDTKVYTKIYNDIVLNFIENTNVDTSAKIARTDLAHQVVDMLEFYVHYYISVVVTIIGSLVFILSGNTWVGIFVLTCSFPIAVIVKHFYKKIEQSTMVGNNHYEKKVDVMHGTNEEIHNFFNRRRRLVIYGSTLQGKNWLSVNSVKYTFLVLAIVLFIKTSPNMTLGEVLAMVTYISNFLISLLSIPVAVEMYTRIMDVLKRLKS